MSGKLFVVPTPIGNLEDITYRAINVLNEVDFILAEDTRKSGILLKRYKITKPTMSYHMHNEHKKVSALMERFANNETAALISDAGTPAISDPGFLLIRECLKNDVNVECLPGATAFIPALVKSGLPSDSFIFEGFLPQKKGRKTKLEELSLEKRTIVLYESPHRILRLLNEIITIMGPLRIVSVSRELTKIYEETFTGNAEVVLTHFENGSTKGEFVVIIEGKGKK